MCKAVASAAHSNISQAWEKYKEQWGRLSLVSEMGYKMVMFGRKETKGQSKVKMYLDWCEEDDSGEGHSDKAEKWEAF